MRSLQNLNLKDILSLEEEEEGEEEKVQVMLADRWVKGGGRKGGGIAGRRMIYELLRGGGDRGSQVGRRSNLFFQSLSLSLSLSPFFRGVNAMFSVGLFARCKQDLG